MFTIMPLFLIPAVLFCSNEKDSQGENMFMRCVSELVIESREVSDPHLVPRGGKKLTYSISFNPFKLGVSRSSYFIHLLFFCTYQTSTTFCFWVFCF